MRDFLYAVLYTICVSIICSLAVFGGMMAYIYVKKRQKFQDRVVFSDANELESLSASTLPYQDPLPVNENRPVSNGIYSLPRRSESSSIIFQRGSPQNLSPPSNPYAFGAQHQPFLPPHNSPPPPLSHHPDVRPKNTPIDFSKVLESMTHSGYTVVYK